MKISLKDFLTVLPTLEKQMHAAIQAELVAIAPQIVETAQTKIGVYQDGWPPLASSTQKDRENLGFSPDDPLLRSGDLRNSYNAIVTDHHITVGSSDTKAEYVEIGTATIPPRPVTLPSVYENLDELKEKLGQATVQGLSNKVDL
jgi:hypothetical protein